MDRLNAYAVFYEVAKAKNITKTGEKLFISQPAVSQTIKKLEEDLSVTLFVRNKKGVELTRFGHKIFQKVETAMLALRAVDQMSKEEQALMQGNIVIASGSNVAREALTLPIKSFLESFPNIQITQIEGVQSDMLNLLRQGEVDLVISQQNEQVEEFPFCPILKHKYVFINKKGTAPKRFIKMLEGSFTHGLFQKFEKQSNLDTLPELVVSGYRMSIELAQLGVGVALVPELLVREQVKRGKLEIVFKDYPLPTVTFGYYFNPVLSTPATEAFIKILNQHNNL